MSEKALLAQKSALELTCERKKWILGETLNEHYKLEVIDSKLLSLGYYDHNQ